MNRNQLWNCTHFRYPTDEQLRHKDISRNSNLLSVSFRFLSRSTLRSATNLMFFSILLDFATNFIALSAKFVKHLSGLSLVFNRINQVKTYSGFYETWMWSCSSNTDTFDRIALATTYCLTDHGRFTLSLCHYSVQSSQWNRYYVRYLLFPATEKRHLDVKYVQESDSLALYVMDKISLRLGLNSAADLREGLGMRDSKPLYWLYFFTLKS